ncbi:MAG: hypothetical protein WDN10_04290 [bacterium]
MRHPEEIFPAGAGRHGAVTASEKTPHRPSFGEGLDVVPGLLEMLHSHAIVSESEIQKLADRIADLDTDAQFLLAHKFYPVSGGFFSRANGAAFQKAVEHTLFSQELAKLGELAVVEHAIVLEFESPKHNGVLPSESLARIAALPVPEQEKIAHKIFDAYIGTGQGAKADLRNGGRRYHVILSARSTAFGAKLLELENARLAAHGLPSITVPNSVPVR